MQGDAPINILVIDDSPKLLRSLGYGLRKLGYSVDLVEDGKTGLDFAQIKNYDVIVLDLMLPGMDGLTVLKNLRSMGKQTHILILSAKDQVEDRVRGLKLGADDYMVKPFSLEELFARLAALIRRRYQMKNPKLVLGALTIDTASREVICNGKPVHLTPGEYAILECLVLNRGRAVSKEHILDSVHDSDSAPSSDVVEVMICTLRKKIAARGEKSIIKTHRGHGYSISE